MKLTARLLRKLVESEKQEMMQEMNLRRNVRSHLRAIFEAEEAAPKAGKAGSEATGTVDVKKIADVLNIDPDALKKAVTNIRGEKRSAEDNKIFGDVFAKLLDADKDETGEVMAVFKKVSAQ